MTQQAQNKLVIYHSNCNDGLAGAWVIKQVYPDAECIPAQYQRSPPDVTGRDVIMVDFSYKRDELLKLLDACNSMEIYDHHASAERELAGLSHPKLKKVVFDMKRSGAGIAWDEFTRGQPRPLAINIIEDYDLWRFQYPETKPLMEAIRSVPRTMESFSLTMKLLMASPELATQLTHIGQWCLDLKTQMVQLACEKAEEVEIAGHRVYATNVPYFLSSECGNELIRDRAFGVTYYRAEDGRWKFSLRSRNDREDVSRIAEKWGGGGHRNAAGFTTDQLPWLVGR